jgi:hypothetical protein
MMGGVHVSDAYLVSYHSTRKRLKKYYWKHFHNLISVASIHICSIKDRRQIYKVGVPTQAYREFCFEVPLN